MTIRTLMVSQAFGSVGVSSGFVVSTLLAANLAPSASLAGLAQTASTVGSAAAAGVLALLATEKGRRAALRAGYLVGAFGAVTCLLGAAFGSFWTFVLGMVSYGAAAAANLQARYAAADGAPAGRRGRALSLIVWITTIGAVLGPNTIGLAATVGLPDLSGSFVFALVGFLVAAAIVHLLPVAHVASENVSYESFQGSRLPLLSLCAGHAAMIAVMSMTSLHMKHGGADLVSVGVVFSVHMAGMYAFSPVFGFVADRWGPWRSSVLGHVVLLASFAFSAASFLVVGLLLLGLGWSCVLVSSSAAMERRAQGLSDVLMNVCAAIAGLGAGVVLDLLGFVALNAVCAALVILVLGCYFFCRTR
ncbi:MFS transporter [Allokutzneria albata]|uniref:Predicted arabinose efflux permease, MFS family n=1 Tax=Allokutzneria albata TaxID=211114 RepID=A0A1G9RIL4_ALLAB|nr:MFS transporter [Allokutzneria albata]SDM23162.1 Predicted arabinose efflux permease, MFS family [Allokutzneria albata]